MIPKLMHQVWMGPHRRPVEWMQTWPRLNPDWEYRLWTEDNFPWPLWNQAQYDATNRWSGRINILRYELLLRCGGLYVDADCEAIQPLPEDVFHGCRLLTSYEHERVVPARLCNAILAAEPGHPVLADLVDRISYLHPGELEPSWKCTGPRLLTRVVNRHRDRPEASIRILPSHLFFPTCWSGAYCDPALRHESIAIHHWGSTNETYPT